MKKVMSVAVAAFAMMSTAALADGDPTKGEVVFKKCAICHAVGAGAKNKVGPELNGVAGAGITQRPTGFAYSKALVDAGAGKVWDDANLTAWLTKPAAFAKGTKMAFAGLTKPEEIADVIAYLKTQTAQ
ncbi:c-type cytochrome [Oryzibacter oryziterrae]|uniref:c-type cytochrome n=1 Tax=Oryzibacter oryziterrae TaxID=2766474 RepID=UPI001F2BEB24|nr:cytochrome c family protein [Oryzibacter oryziterrae]